MHARIYFLIVILTSAVIATFKDEQISLLTSENEALKRSLQAHSAVASGQLASSQPFSFYEGYLTEASEPRLIFGNPSESPKPEGSLASYREKIDFMESHLKRYRHEALGYQMMVDALKNEINLREGELQQLRASIARYEAENQMVTAALDRKERDLNEALAVLNDGQKEAALEQKLQDLTKSLRFAEADACYARAQLAEAAADKIFFSTARKKACLREALEGYKKAHFLGKLEAVQDISRLQQAWFPEFAALQ